jgi:hypothetical protein
LSRQKRSSLSWPFAGQVVTAIPVISASPVSSGHLGFLYAAVADGSADASADQVQCLQAPWSPLSDVLWMVSPEQPEFPGVGGVMTAPVTIRGRDLHALAGIVTRDRPDLQDAEGLPPSLLADLMAQIRCARLSFLGFDSGRQETWLAQRVPANNDMGNKAINRAHWEHYWDCKPCSHPDRTGDLRSIVKIEDFYSARLWHSTGMYCDFYRPRRIDHELQLCLPEPPGQTHGPGRTVRLYFLRGPGPDFSECDRAMLTLLRLH